MADSLKASLRYRVIDRCLKDRNRRYFKEDLIEAIFQEYQLRGIDRQRPSERTVDYDIEHMRSGELGFEAPISFSKERGYYYEDPSFSIYKPSLHRAAIHDLIQTLELMKQIAGTENLAHLAQSITILEQELQIETDHIEPIIYYEQSTNEAGKKWLGDLYDKIRKKKSLNIDYKPFDKPGFNIIMAPYNLYEFNNRWYVAGWDYESEIIAFVSLDRIKNIKESIRPFYKLQGFDIKEYMAKTYGIRRPNYSFPEEIKIKVSRAQSNYIDTKPIHTTQKKLYEEEMFIVYSLEVIVNYEIKSKLLSFGKDLVILSPLDLRDAIFMELHAMIENYDTVTHRASFDDELINVTHFNEEKSQDKDYSISLDFYSESVSVNEHPSRRPEVYDGKRHEFYD